MEPSKKKPTPEAIRQKARQLIQIQTGWATFDLQVSADSFADSRQVVYIARAARPDVPNDAGFTLWLDASGQALADKPYHRLASSKVDLAALRTRHARSFAGGEPITIDPNVNVLTLNQGDTFSETIYANIPANARRTVDVYLLVDTTGSMGDNVAQIVAAFGSIEAALASSGHDVAYGVGDYLDFPSDPYAFRHLLSISNDSTQINAALANLATGDGHDIAEAQLYALYQVATDPGIGWRPGAKRLIFWVGDAPGHEPICGAYTSGGFDLYRGDVIAALQAAQITVLAASITSTGPGGLDVDPNPLSGDYLCGSNGAPYQATDITSQTGGAVLDGLNTNDIVLALLSLVGSEMNQANTVQLVPTGATAPFVASIYPGSYGPIDLSVPNNLPFQVEFVGNVPCATTAQVFYGTIDLVIDGEVVAQKQVEITVPPCDGCGCDDWSNNADATLQAMANDLYNTIPATGSACAGTLPGTGEGCTTFEVPNLAPCFLLKWGDGPRDQFETEDFEVVLLAICNPFKNIAFGCLKLFNLRVVKADGSPVETLPDGTPTVMVVPGARVDICEVAPCSCVYQELVVKSCGALEGGYKLLFDYCIEEVKIVCTTGAAEFPLELWRS